jgi:hypothetical protein
VLLDSIIAAEACEALAAAAATARDVAADAVAEAAHAQLHLQLATNNRAITALIACRQAEAAYTVALDRASAAQDAYVRGDPHPQISRRRFDISMYYV